MLEKLLKNLAKAMDADKIPYMIIGGQAVLLYGEPRLTKDIDITIGFGPEFLGRLKSIIEKLGFKILVSEVENFVKQTFVLPTLDEKSGFKVDFIFSLSPYEREAMQRVNIVNLGKVKLKIASLEDLIIHKVIAGRPRDMEDIKNILLKNPTFDKEYIIKWLREFDHSMNGGFVVKLEKFLKEDIGSG